MFSSSQGVLSSTYNNCFIFECQIIYNIKNGGGYMRETQAENQLLDPKRPANTQHMLKFIIFSLIGIFTFFVPITINGTSTIPLDHMVTFVRETFPTLVPYYILAIILLVAVHPFVNKSWNKHVVTIVLSLFNVFGLLVSLMLIFHFGPSWIHEENMGPFLFDSLVT